MSGTRDFLAAMWSALGGAPAVLEHVHERDAGHALPSVFAVSDLASAAIAAAGAAVAELIGARAGTPPAVVVDRRLASLWFGWSIRPEGWTVPSPWDPIAGDYAAADGWIRLHTNAPHHRAAALSVLGVPAAKDDVARAVAAWPVHDLEAAVVARGGCAAAMRTRDAWALHEQGRAVAGEPLVALHTTGRGARSAPRVPPDVPVAPRDAADRPLAGVRVLDLTRVLAGPVATRLLAGFGADVLRIDPPGWDEPGVVPEVTLGKRCARLDLAEPAGRERLAELLAGADVLVHSYRPGALDRLGFDAATRRALRPGLVEVTLDAYGWTGPWRDRRGFDSLVQMSAGIAAEGMRVLGRDRPTPLPVQALDHATGYLMAAAAVRGIAARERTGEGLEARLSLARTAALLVAGPQGDPAAALPPPADADWCAEREASGFGPLARLRPPLAVAGAPLRWNRPAALLGSSDPRW